MKHATGYVLRHQRRGIIVDKIYLKKPSVEEFRRATRDLGPGWCSLVPVILEGPDELEPIFAFLEPMGVEATEKIHAESRSSGHELVPMGVGVVTPPKAGGKG